MHKIPSLTPKKLLRVLRKAGFEIDHATGSHYILYHPQTGKRALVAYHCKDLPKGTTRDTLKAAGISEKDLRNLL